MFHYRVSIGRRCAVALAPSHTRALITIARPLALSSLCPALSPPSSPAPDAMPHSLGHLPRHVDLAHSAHISRHYPYRARERGEQRERGDVRALRPAGDGMDAESVHDGQVQRHTRNRRDDLLRLSCFLLPCMYPAGCHGLGVEKSTHTCTEH